MLFSVMSSNVKFNFKLKICFLKITQSQCLLSYSINQNNSMSVVF